MASLLYHVTTHKEILSARLLLLSLSALKGGCVLNIEHLGHSVSIFMAKFNSFTLVLDILKKTIMYTDTLLSLSKWVARFKGLR